jgi:hypothetical protein
MTKQTTFRTVGDRAGRNISLPFGIIEMVRAGFRRLRLYEFLDSFKTKGVPLSYVVELMCIHQLDGGSSMNKCGAMSSSDLVIEELCHGHRISRKTMERALDALDTYFEETIGFLWERSNEIYPGMCTDVYVDGSHIERCGPEGKYTAAGVGGRTIQLQDQFVVARLLDPGIPMMIEAYPGNWNDPMQYHDFIPQLMFMLKKGSMVIMDAGGSVKAILDEIKDADMEYLTRMSLFPNDGKIIREDIGKMDYVGRGVVCFCREFDSTDKTNYYFFSVDRYYMGMRAAERRTKKQADDLKSAREAAENPKVSKLVTVKKNPFYEIGNISCDILMTLDPWLDDDVEKAIETNAGEMCVWFKLQCSKRLMPGQVLDLYRHRSGIEHLISSIKNVVRLKPLRVWSRGSVRGSLLLALIAQLIVSMVRHDLEPEAVSKWDDGKRVMVQRKPSERTICETMGHWTVTVISSSEWKKERIFSNETELSERISKVLERY